MAISQSHVMMSDLLCQEGSTFGSIQISDKNYSAAFQQYATMHQEFAGNACASSASETLTSTCKELELLIPKLNYTNAIQHATKSMRSIISLLKGTLADDKVTPLEPTSTYAANTNNKKQLRFHSTKKKKENHSNWWSKLTVDEELSICNKLSTVDVKFCGVCVKENDGCTESYYPVG